MRPGWPNDEGRHRANRRNSGVGEHWRSGLVDVDLVRDQLERFPLDVKKYRGTNRETD